LLLFAGSGCGAEVDSSRMDARRLFRGAFQDEVYPVLIRDCGFDTCHGAPERTFRVWGPGRVRIPNAMGILPDAFDDPTGDEISTTHSLAQAMIDARAPGRSLLLRKPLAVEAGGAGHLGVDQWGRDVYRTTEDHGYQVLLSWVFGPEPGGTPPPTPTTP
jgi:hypothetical protein